MIRVVRPAEAIDDRVAIGVPLAAGVFAFFQSYMRWLDPVIDACRDLYVPEQIRHGLTLYRDIRMSGSASRSLS